MVPDAYGQQHYLTGKDWDSLDSQIRQFKKSGFFITSLSSCDSGYACIVSKVPDWNHETVRTSWAANLKTGERDLDTNKPLVNLFFKDKMAIEYSYEGTGIAKQYLFSFDTFFSVVQAYKEEIRSSGYIISGLDRFDDKIFITVSYGPAYNQFLNEAILFLNLPEKSCEIPYIEGMITTEFLFYLNKTLTVYTKHGMFSEETAIINPSQQHIKDLKGEGYSLSLVRGIEDVFIVYFVR